MTDPICRSSTCLSPYQSQPGKYHWEIVLQHRKVVDCINNIICTNYNKLEKGTDLRSTLMVLLNLPTENQIQRDLQIPLAPI